MISDYSKSILHREMMSLVWEYDRIQSTIRSCGPTNEIKNAIINLKMKIKRIQNDLNN